MNIKSFAISFGRQTQKAANNQRHFEVDQSTLWFLRKTKKQPAGTMVLKPGDILVAHPDGDAVFVKGKKRTTTVKGLTTDISGSEAIKNQFRKATGFNLWAPAKTAK